MVEIERTPAFSPPRRRFDARELSRLATWGLATLAALTLAAYAASSEIGEDRLIVAVASIRGVPPPERLARAPADAPTRHLAETVRELTADRQQLLARLDSLERNVGDVTSSIARAGNPPAASPPSAVTPLPAPVPIVAAPDTTPTPPTPPPDSFAARAAAIQPPPTPSDDPAPVKTEFGIDLGRANTVEGLRQLWAALQGKHGGALEGLRPIVTVREIARQGGIDLRLVAGPLPNAASAARLCATLAGAACHPTVFDGQRLALR
jgi:hypothetical protein